MPQPRNAVLQTLLAAIGPNTEIKPPFRYDYGIHITIGAGVFINHDCIILDCNRVTISDRVLIAPKSADLHIQHKEIESKAKDHER